MATNNNTPNPFDNLRTTRADRAQSFEWFKLQIKSLNRASYQPKTLLKSTRHLVMNPTPGKMYLWKYSAKWKDQLPYWDACPVAFFLEKKDNERFYGINLHYMNYAMRWRLLDNLYQLANNNRFDATTRLKMTWDILSRLSQSKNLGVESCIKMYRYDHMESRFLEISSSSWPIVALLPIEQFQKATKERVWYDTKQRV